MSLANDPSKLLVNRYHDLMFDHIISTLWLRFNPKSNLFMGVIPRKPYPFNLILTTSCFHYPGICDVNYIILERGM